MVISSLERHKSAGVCGIYAEMLRDGGAAATAMIHDLIVVAWEQERLPAEWTKSPVYKAGDLAVLDNYRGISLISVPCKVFSLIIQRRLAAWVDSQLLELQCGFRNGRSCNDAIFCMRLLHEHAVRNKQPMLTCFVDLSKAYNSVDRRLAWQCFKGRGMPAKFEAIAIAAQPDHVRSQG